MKATMQTAALKKSPVNADGPNPAGEWKIETTSDYSLFRKLEGNRPVSERHVQKLMRSMRENDLFSPIAVNSKMEVIDGQHRLEARKRLKLPISYYIVKSYGLQEVQTLNAQQKKWNVDDYLQSNLELGNKEYEVYQWFREKYGFDHTVCLKLLCDDFQGKELHQAFNIGLFRVKNLMKAKEMAEMLIRIEPFYKGFRRRSFVLALMTLSTKKAFKFEVFLQKLETQPATLKDCATADQYIDLIEQIYNYRSQNKVSLRYGD